MEADFVARAARIAALGLRQHLTGPELVEVREAADDPVPTVREAAVAALVRSGPVRTAASAWSRATGDADPRVRRRAADVAPALAARRRTSDPTLVDGLVTLVGDDDVTVVEAAAWALGEVVTAGDVHAVDRLASLATDHRDALAREAAVGALGAIGDARGLPAVLVACRDKPAVRRRAVLALAPFDGPDVDAAITAALEDRDWQVRQAAEDLRAEDLGAQDLGARDPGG